MIRVLAALLGLTALTAGCSSNEPLPAAEVLNHRNCKAMAAGMRRVSYPEVAELGGSTLLTMTGPEAPTPSPDLLLLAISKGAQPTPGYHFELADAYLRQGVAIIELGWNTPDPAALLPQVMTHPCIVVGLEQGAFRRVRAVDDNGELLGELAL